MSELPLEPTPIAAHTRTGDDALAALGSRPSGLSAAEAAARLAGEGPNELQAAARTSAWKMLLGQLKNALIIVLLVATALSAALGHRLEAIVITIIVFFAVMLGFVQEYRAGRAIDALRKMAAPGATVLRDGDTVRVPVREVVRGDILLLKAGDRVTRGCWRRSTWAWRRRRSPARACRSRKTPSRSPIRSWRWATASTWCTAARR